MQILCNSQQRHHIFAGLRFRPYMVIFVLVVFVFVIYCSGFVTVFHAVLLTSPVKFQINTRLLMSRKNFTRSAES